MEEYLKAQNKTNEVILGNSITTDEINRFSKSDFRWAENRKRTLQNRTIKKGEIYQFEFGKNYIPEMSYEHRGLVIGVKRKFLYVLPIFSYDPHRHTDVYHSIDSPTSTSDMFLLKSSEFSFISHDSVLKLNDIRSVSVNRVLYKQTGRIDPFSDVYKEIESLVLRKYFPNFFYDYENDKKTLELLRSQVLTLTKDKNSLENEIEKMKFELDSLKMKTEIRKENIQK